jgi:hypothetical protein
MFLLCQHSPDNLCIRQQHPHMARLGALYAVAELHHDGTIQSTWKEAHLAQHTDQCSTEKKRAKRHVTSLCDEWMIVEAFQLQRPSHTTPNSLFPLGSK